MMILSMLEEGKITSEEAIKLMEAIEEEEAFSKDRSESSTYKKEEKFNLKDTLDNIEDIGTDIGNALYGLFDGLKDFGSSFGRYNYETVTNNLTMDLSGLENPSLDLRAINGDININPSQEDSITIDVTCQYKKGLLVANEAYFDFINKNGTISFIPKYNSNISIKLDVSLPEKHYDYIQLKTSNGKIYTKRLDARSAQYSTSNASINLEEANVELIDLTTKNGRIEINNTNSKDIKAYTTNASIEVKNTNSEKIVANTGNGKIILNDISSLDTVCKTSNGSIDIDSIDSSSLSLTTSNAKINISKVNPRNMKNLRLLTSNASINADLDALDSEIIIDLETSMGSINIDFEELIYITNKQLNLGLKKIVAHSKDYDPDKDHLNLVASTSNGSITIN